MLQDIEEVTKRFKERLESGFYTSRREEYRKAFPEEFENNNDPYELFKEERDTEAVKEFVKSDLFQELILRS